MKKVYKKFTLQSVTAQGDRLPEKAQKAIKGGLENCWSYTCYKQSCGQPLCEGDEWGISDNPNLFEELESRCHYGFVMQPCQ